MSQEISISKLYMVIIVLSIAIVLLAAGLYTGRQIEERTLSVSGSSSVSSVPDTASIGIGVIVQADTSKEASERNAASMNAVIAELKKIGLQDKEIQTSFLSVQPVYRYPDGGEPQVVGYSASNNVQVTTRMLDRVGEIVDRSAEAGANQIIGISFSISEEKQKQVREGLITEAVNDAYSKASKLAESLDARIVGVRTSSISEGGFPQPFFAPSAVAEKAATPIQPGELTVTVSVQVTYIIK